LNPAYRNLWSTVNCPYPHGNIDCWPWVIAVAQVLKEEPDREASIQDVWKRLLQPGQLPIEDTSFAFVAIFGVLCWVTMTLCPTLSVDQLQAPACLTCKSQTSSEEAPQQKLEKCRRPITALFRTFKPHAWGPEPTTPTALDENLYEASLNYYSLNEFANISIGWVDTISDHLKFNPASRRLYLFRFPTFCILQAIHTEERGALLHSIAEALDPVASNAGNQDCYITLEQEVLLSYRLLFGKSTRSRKLAHSELAALKSDGRPFDQLLTPLCESRYRTRLCPWSRRSKHDRTLEKLPDWVWPVSCRDSEGNLQESDVYNAGSDFPRLGRRLLELQKFNLRQRPSRLTDFWRDRRNPLQWYTFWIVLLVGGAGVILALLQLAVGIMQLVRSW
ncbi:hypothetical protein B0T24DRAFT_694480, partial [Lasiosphaeria ovina]